MLTNTTLTFILPLVGSIFTIIVGYFVFRNDQTNKNRAVETRFKNMSKDINKNEDRLRKDFNDQNLRNEKIFSRMEKDLFAIQERQIQEGHDNAANKATMVHLEKTMNNISDKLDIVIQSLVNNNEQS